MTSFEAAASASLSCSSVKDAGAAATGTAGCSATGSVMVSNAVAAPKFVTLSMFTSTVGSGTLTAGIGCAVADSSSNAKVSSSTGIHCETVLSSAGGTSVVGAAASTGSSGAVKAPQILSAAAGSSATSGASGGIIVSCPSACIIDREEPSSISALTLVTICWDSKGLERKSSAPQLFALVSSNGSNDPVNRRIGLVEIDAVARTASQTSYPDMPGIRASMSRTSGLISRAFSTAALPLSTTVREYSSLPKMMPTTFWMVILSSARRILMLMCPS